MAPPTTERDAPSYPIESVNNALRLLLMLREQPHLRLTTASAALGVAPSTAHRLLAMLEYNDFVRNDETLRAYVAGQALTEVGRAVVKRLVIRGVARPVLQRLRQVTNETVHLAMLTGSNVLYLDSFESGRGLRVTSRIGRSLPACCTSVGKAILASLPEAELTKIYPAEELPVQTSESLATRADLRRELWKIREAGGVATNHGESEQGVGSVGIALPRTPGGRLTGISLAVPLVRLTDEATVELAGHLRKAADELGELIKTAEVKS